MASSQLQKNILSQFDENISESSLNTFLSRYMQEKTFREAKSVLCTNNARLSLNLNLN
jgi:hypothetical protein